MWCQQTSNIESEGVSHVYIFICLYIQDGIVREKKRAGAKDCGVLPIYCVELNYIH